MFSFLKQSFVALLLRIFGVALSLVIFAILAKTLNIHDVGVFSLVASAALVGRYLGPLGLDQIALRTIPQYCEEDKLPEAMALQKLLIIYAAIASTIIASGFAAISFAVWDGPHFLPIIITTVLIYVSSTVSGICAGILRGHGRIFSAFFPDSVLSFLVTALLMALSLLWGALTTEFALYFLTAGTICAAGLQLLSVFKLSPPSARRSPLREVAKQSVSIRKAGHYWLVMAGNFLQVRSSLYVAFLVGSSAASALMDTAMKFALVPTLATWAVGSVCAPRLVSLRTKGDLQGIRNILFVGAWISFIPSLLFLFLFILSGKFVIETFLSPNYVSAYVATILFVLATCLNSFLSLASTYLMYADEEVTVLKFTLVGLFCTVFFGYILGASSLGVTGVAIAVLISGVCRDGGLAIILYRKTGLLPGLSASSAASAWRTLKQNLRKERF
jgi:O-antigen/teichoic acid export membrane protein